MACKGRYVAAPPLRPAACRIPRGGVFPLWKHLGKGRVDRFAWSAAAFQVGTQPPRPDWPPRQPAPHELPGSALVVEVPELCKSPQSGVDVCRRISPP